MSSSSPSSYFDTFYPRFSPDDSVSILSNFRRLAKLKGWGPDSKRYRKEYQKCLNSEYREFVGCVFSRGKLDGWRDLCEEVGIRNPPSSITGCKKVSSNIDAQKANPRRSTDQPYLLNRRSTLSMLTSLTSSRAVDKAKRSDCFPILKRFESIRSSTESFSL